ncbi:unnamed protein product [Brachionus calyciflorus]|uniref:Uncharacterized protein n=1 Tax=Brachionus calyciflorus TaxID=104777 RepID=A0A814L950_9BILA|nr:unnamed protein product [Brachionus calyciflorus]
MRIEKTHAIIQWDQQKKKYYDIIKIDDIFLDENDDDILIENSYEFRQKKNKGYGVSTCIVKYLGTKNNCEKNFSRISSYTQFSRDKISKNKTSCSSISVENIRNNLNLESSSKKLAMGNNKRKIMTIESDSDKENSNFLVREQDKESELNQCLKDDMERKLKDRDDLIKCLNEKLETKNRENKDLNEQLETYKQLTDPSLLQRIVPLSIQVLKYVGTDKDRDEVKKLRSSNKEILINEDYEGIYMHKNLYNSTLVMIEEKSNPTKIFRNMAKALIPDESIWTQKTGSEMDESYFALKAAKEFLVERKVNLTDSLYRLVLRGICSESKSEMEKSQKKKAK